MAGVIRITDGVAYSTSGRVFHHVATQLRSILADDPVLMPRLVGAEELGHVTVDDLSAEEVEIFLDALSRAVAELREMPSPPEWSYVPPRYWDDIRQGAQRKVRDEGPRADP